MSEPLTLEEFLEAVLVGNEWLDTDVSPEYQAQPLAHLWARVTKVYAEEDEVLAALSNWTGENPRKGICGTKDALVGELADRASASILAIQHLTGNTRLTWAALCEALDKVCDRAATRGFTGVASVVDAETRVFAESVILEEKDLLVEDYSRGTSDQVQVIKITHIPTGLFAIGDGRSGLHARESALEQLKQCVAARANAERMTRDHRS
jgi:hypothetical protein